MSIIQKRKLLRLHNFDYSCPGAYFITFCTHGRKCILSKITSKTTDSYGAQIITPVLTLSDFGNIVSDIIKTIPERFDVKLNHYVIMPNHIHLIVDINFNALTDSVESYDQSEIYRSVISKIVGFIKMNSSKELRKTFSIKNVWQRGYHDHVIRNRDDYIAIAEYINDNPKRWFYDKYYISE